MGHLISVEIEDAVAKNILKQIKLAMPPLDEDEEAQYKLYRAIEDALENDDA